MTHFGPHLDPFLTPFDPINQGENGVSGGSKKGSKKGQKWVKKGVKKGSEIAWNGTKMTTFGTLFGVMHSGDVQMPLPLWIAYVYWPDYAKMVIRWKRVQKPLFSWFWTPRGVSKASQKAFLPKTVILGFSGKRVQTKGGAEWRDEGSETQNAKKPQNRGTLNRTVYRIDPFLTKMGSGTPLRSVQQACWAEWWDEGPRPKMAKNPKMGSGTRFWTLLGVMHSSDVQMPIPLWIAYVYWPDYVKMDMWGTPNPLKKCQKWRKWRFLTFFGQKVTLFVLTGISEYRVWRYLWIAYD